MFPQCLHCNRRHDPQGLCDPADLANARATLATERQAEVDLLEDDEIRQYVLRWRWRHRPAA